MNVFSNGIWKSGNNLLVKLLIKLDYKSANLGVAASLVNGRFFWARQIIRGGGFDKSPVMVGLEKSACISSKWLTKRLHGLDGSYVSAHAAYSDQLLSILELNNFRVVHIVRDPRDVIVSFSHWIETRPDFFLYPIFSHLTLEERMRLMMTGYNKPPFVLDSIFTVLDRTYGWMTNNERVLVVRFEDLVGEKGGGSDVDQIACIKRICSWVGRSEEAAEDIGRGLFGGTTTFRKGRIGAWREEMPRSLQDLFHELSGGRLGLFQYD